MMPSNQFLDYLCSMGYAHRLDSVVTVPRPSYPNDKALEPAGTRYFSTITQYTVEFGIAQMDNTKVVIPMYRRASLQPDPNGLTILEKILAFLEYLGRQRGGIPFTSKHGGQGPGYRAQYVENPVGADDILMAMSLFGPPPGTWLDRAWAVEYLRSFLVELRQNEAEYKEKEKEILATPSKIGEYFPNKGEYEAKKKEIFEKYKKETEDKRSSENNKFNSNDTIVVDSVFRLNISVDTITQPVILGGYARGENKYILNGNIYYVDDTLEIRKIAISRQDGVITRRDTISTTQVKPRAR